MEKRPSRELLKRISSCSVDYEKECRRTILRYASSVRMSKAVFHREKDEISDLLQKTLESDDLDQTYIELLRVLFPTAKDRDRKDSEPLIQFLQKVFRLDSNQHAKLYECAKSHKDEDKMLYLEVIEARNLPAKDMDGLSDPFCTLYVTSKETSKRTRMCEKTLNPHWNESFKFKLKEPEKDFLTIEIWDHDPEENVRDKLKRCKDITSARGLGHFIRELAQGSSSPHQDFMGKIGIPLKEASSETTERWWPLGDNALSGEIYLRMGIGLEKERAHALKWYRIALQVLIIHDLMSPSVIVPFQWEHVKEAWGEYILRQMHTGWGLSPKDALLAKWVAYTRLNFVFPLSGRMMPILIFETFEAAINGEFNANDVSIMVQSSHLIIEGCMNYVEKLHDFLPCTVTTSQLYYILKAVEILGKSLDRLRISCDNRTIFRTDMTTHTVTLGIQTAIRKAAIRNLQTLGEALEIGSAKHEKVSLPQAKKMLELGQLINEDLKKGHDVVDKDFKMIVRLDYHQITYEVYDFELEKLMKPFVLKFCIYLSELCVQSNAMKSSGDPKLIPDVTSSFLHLYLCLRKFSELAPSTSTQINPIWKVKGVFHDWFYPGVSHLFDLFSKDWVNWIEKAVILDYEGEGPKSSELVAIPKEAPTVVVTPSAGFSAELLTSVQSFWNTLKWPEPQQASIFAKKLLKELSGFVILFANLTLENMLKKDESSQNAYYISVRLCRAVNNIQYVGDCTKEIAEHLNLEQLLIDIQNESSESSFLIKQAEIQETGIATVINEIFGSVLTKMETCMRNLIKAAITAHEIQGKDSAECEKALSELLKYVYANLHTLDDNLISAYFVPFLTRLWEDFLQYLRHASAAGIRDGKSCEYFAGLRNILDTVKQFFEGAILSHSGRIPGGLGPGSLLLSKIPKYSALVEELDTYGATVDFIKSRYFTHRYETQKNTKDGNRGAITVTVMYHQDADNLSVEVLNGRKLLPADSNGKSDPFVVLQLIPEERFPGGGTQTTKVVKEDLFPIFEEKFNMKVLPKQMGPGSFLRLIVYDYDYFKNNEFLGECYLPLTAVQNAKTVKMPIGTESTLLPLTAPSNAEIELLKSLIRERVHKDLKRLLDIEMEKQIVPTTNA